MQRQIFHLERILVLTLLVISLTTAKPAAATAAERWIVDPASGCRIAWIMPETSTLVAASWTGAQVDGKAEGQGRLKVVIKGPDGKELAITVDPANMKAGKLNGEASEVWSNGLTFTGTYRDGWRDGKGIMRLPNGMIYDGDFVANRLEGKAVIKWPNPEKPDVIARIYEGDVKNGMPEGKGIMRFLVSGYTYEGDFHNGTWHGQGVLTGPNGQVVFSGEFKNGQPVKKSADGQNQPV